jgi:UDP-glucose 4-epimerase
VARAVILAAAHPDAGGKIFNVTDGSVHTVAEIVAAIREALGETWPVPRVPVLAARTAAHAIELAGRVTGRPPFVSRHMIDKLVEDVAIDGRRLRQVLSFTPAFNLRDGWADTIAGLRERREVDTSRSFPARIRS